MSVTVRRGVVLSFSPAAGKGVVDLGDRVVVFDETCFRSGRPVRSARVGDEVEVLFSPTERDLLSVRVAE